MSAAPAAPRAARLGLNRLARVDPDLGRIEREVGRLPWRTREPGFGALLSAIVSQQISNQAAAAIWGRLCVLPGCLAPERFLALGDAELRGAGMSRPKIGHARALAEAFGAGVLATEALAALDDAGAIAAISSVRGLGAWSAEVYLLFALERADVFPAGDLALQASLADLKGFSVRPSARELRVMAEAWAPYRALAARLLWHWWRHRTGRPSMDESQPGAAPAVEVTNGDG
jgi:DNA-3-methyladenine glycosylase II